MDSILAIAIAVAGQLPYHLAYASPWLVAAVTLCFLCRKARRRRVVISIATFVAAIGLTPIFGFHLSMVPLFMASNLSAREAIVPFVITWAGLFLAFCLAWPGSRIPAPQA